jgi:hypothetical protein
MTLLKRAKLWLVVKLDIIVTCIEVETEPLTNTYEDT